ncbi:uncharacterized protein LOC143278193 isoform X2 [Babylonia areolata]|uniref:uncharacterized protein LOC143278193 isoform X2 n=1 Tax=Babylonia areolata TaxID=304850 RepID=UPI003FD57BA1
MSGVPPIDRDDRPANTVILKFAKLSKEASTPTRGSEQAAGYDLYSAYDYTVPAGVGVLRSSLTRRSMGSRFCEVSDRASHARPEAKNLSPAQRITEDQIHLPVWSRGRHARRLGTAPEPVSQLQAVQRAFRKQQHGEETKGHSTGF